ncbi:MAG: TonB-dependent receptor plug domain-containing protein, partial [Burkholderiales bacterium]
PAVASVITAEDIARNGASSLDEILQWVPGLYVARGQQADVSYVIRGINHNRYNPQVLMMYNGVAQISPYLGNRGDMQGTLPVDNIQRIEIIRGPGSALYGADAFSGVINIITKNAADLDGTLAGGRIESYGGADVWLQHGGQLGPVSVAAYLRMARTDGPDEIIRADQQTRLDQSSGSQTSLAPGPMTHPERQLQGQLDLQLQDWRWRLGYRQNYHQKINLGINEVLDPDADIAATQFNSDLNWLNRSLLPGAELSMGLQYSQRRVNTNPLHLLQNGYSVYPQGMLVSANRNEQVYGIDAGVLLESWQRHRLTLGAGFQHEAISDYESERNFRFVYIPGRGYAPLPTGALQAAGAGATMGTHARNLRFIYAQDEWQLANDWQLTAGLRHDHYADFGGTTNPRAALVWEAAYNLTGKLLYGRAFRAPSFLELYAVNNPVANGNPGLQPETIDTTELAISWQPAHNWRINGNLFRYRINDMIRFVTNADPSTGKTAQNSGKQNGHGLELESSWQQSGRLKFSGNYAWQQATESQSNQTPADAPRHLLRLLADWRAREGWQVQAGANLVAGRERAVDDGRAAPANYATLDLTLQRPASSRQIGITLKLRNLFDKQAYDPTPAPGNIPDDYPLPGRSYMLQLHYWL